MGKGSKQRPTDLEKFAAEFNRIFSTRNVERRKQAEVGGSTKEGRRK